jgi:sulfite exporter TauE/SafE
VIETVAGWTFAGMLLAGLAGSAHCLGMCGPFIAGFSTLEPESDRRTRWIGRLLHHLGRAWTYAMLGALAGIFGGQAAGLLGEGWPRALPAIAALALAAIALFGVFPSIIPAGGKLGKFWQSLGATARRLGATPGAPARLLSGVLHGLLPCGLVYLMLVPAASLGGPLRGAIGMAAFALGTVPALLLVQALGGTIAPWVRRSRRLAAVCFLLAAVALAWRATRTPHQHAVQNDQGSDHSTMAH